MEDSFIVTQVNNGNTQAFRLLVLRYQKSLFRYLLSFHLPQSHVEELAQETFVRSFKSLKGYDSQKAEFSTWLFVIAKNLALNELSRHSYNKEIQINKDSDSVEYETPLSALEKKELSKNMKNWLSMLPRQFQGALTLFHLNEMSLEEIAEIESCSVGTVKSRIFRGKELLKELIVKNFKEGL